MLSIQDIITKGYSQRNYFNDRIYLGLKNQETLTAAGFTSPFWLTMNQARKSGLRIRKGSKSEEVVYYKYEDDDGNKLEKPKVYRWKVFNLDQCTQPETTTA